MEAFSGGFGRDSVIHVLSSFRGSGETPMEEFTPAPQKYTVEKRIGKGGMGEVFLVTDADLRRKIAMKVLRRELQIDSEALSQFVAEAQATSQLDHPGIPPVHDIGITSDKRVYFTMKLLKGHTLAEVLAGLKTQSLQTRTEYSLHRLATILERIAETLHFAHERGVIHRDIKPANVMLGDFGEVYVMDWGLARVMPRLDTGRRVLTERTEKGVETFSGVLKGTLPYMSPEQALGRTDSIDRRTDVYAMGCVLYEMLTLNRPFDAGAVDIFKRVVWGDAPPVRERNPDRPVPEELAAVCERAMAEDRDDRHPTAGEFAAALRAWLDGSAGRIRRHKEAKGMVERADRAAREHERAQAQAAEAEAAVERLKRKYHAWHSVVKKKPLLEAQQRARELRDSAAMTFADAIKLYDGALVHDESNKAARAALVGLWKEQTLEAERIGDQTRATYSGAMLSRYSEDDVTPFIEARACCRLQSKPAGAEVVLYRYKKRNGLLVAKRLAVPGLTPIKPLDLPRGSYLAILKLDGYRNVRYPFRIDRGQDWDGFVQMRTDHEIGADFVFVPASRFLFGDPGRETELPYDFAIQRLPVTFGDYAKFLMAEERDMGRGAALSRLPRGRGRPYVIREDLGVYRIQTGLVTGAQLDQMLQKQGPGFEARLPVVGVTWADARAYCAWKTRETGREWRLPTEKEREKAARGVDGRTFPWGELADASLGKCRNSRHLPSKPEAVGTFQTAKSVYGVHDAAGGVWDWVDSLFEEGGSARVLRGGSWGSGVAHMACAVRHMRSPGRRSPYVGFRCAITL